MKTALYYVALVAAAVLASVFAMAALPKLNDPQAFAEAIRNYQLIPDSASEWLGILLPPLELVAALGLLIPHFRRGAAVVVSAMTIGFTGAILYVIMNDINIDCGCFGSSAHAQADWLSVLRNVGLLLCAALAFFFGTRPPSTAGTEIANG